MPKILSHPILIVGGGLAGLRAAVEASQLCDVAVICKVPPLRSQSAAAQDGLNAALGNHPDGQDDSWEQHAFDTIKGSDYLADQNAVEIMCREAIERVQELEQWGTPFSRFEDGRIAQRSFGGRGFPRTCYAADRTGYHLVNTLWEQVAARGVAVYEEWLVTSLIVDNGVCIGVVALNVQSGELQAFASSAVIMATGGFGRLYHRSTNAPSTTGSGVTIAYRAGTPIEDVEFVQFHPTTLFGSNILVTEEACGEGGHLLNRAGERFMERYAPEDMERAPMNIVARAIQTELNEGRGFPDGYVHLDIRHLGEEKIKERLPHIRQIVMESAAVDPIEEPIPVQPGQHYSMGGIAADVDGQTKVPGLYAVGECSCVSVHGANRLGGNSLLETIIFGKRAGEAAAQYVSSCIRPSQAKTPRREALLRDQEKVEALMKRDQGEHSHVIRERLQTIMTEKVGLLRQEGPLKEALEEIRELKERGHQVALDRDDSQDLVNVLELEGMLDLAEAVTAGALARQESRGSHHRLDYPDRDDENWLKHALCHYTEMKPRQTYRDVTITRYQPA